MIYLVLLINTNNANYGNKSKGKNYFNAPYR
ncbi:MAG: hypothetical protein BWX62_00484 [Bacteroidetes bacterium ADurb.Bin037]|nr:MAG: hypothetical protein BWX62_00484 [Bacteroidetes bacterium ADurb.Bin037]